MVERLAKEILKALDKKIKELYHESLFEEDIGLVWGAKDAVTKVIEETISESDLHNLHNTTLNAIVEDRGLTESAMLLISAGISEEDMYSLGYEEDTLESANKNLEEEWL